ncbi:A-kinase-interacting protein 1 isoform X1 [Periophthalmus magnuspinnatus]|uniref:A-kinase-interacting protein 1 isoform X1 n=1 Tax=Periophthalmus magnuspinnatus TaxID=409849 RepID=UPI00145B88EE|nr:A-kinase-interacting protein 1 isoform X1 [Periophthalmus magnuspinnatus]
MSDLDVSLRRSLVLGLEVLERASKRRVDWTRIRPMGHSLNSAQRESREERHEETKQKTPEHRGQRAGVELTEAFSSLSGFMCQMSLLCQRYHVSLASLSHSEHTHVCRFHSSSSAPLSSSAPASAPLYSSSHPMPREDFYIEVRPGTYSITASDPESPRHHLVSPGNETPWQQTHLVSLNDGETVLLTFHL